MDDEHEWYDAGEKDDEPEECEDGDTIIKAARVAGEDYIHVGSVTRIVELTHDICVDAFADTVMTAVVDAVMTAVADAGNETKRRVAMFMKAFGQRVENAGVGDAGNPEEQA